MTNRSRRLFLIATLAAILLASASCAPPEEPKVLLEIDGGSGTHTRGFDEMVGKNLVHFYVWEKQSGKSRFGVMVLTEKKMPVRISISYDGTLRVLGEIVADPPSDGFLYVLSQDGRLWKSSVTIDELRSLGGEYPISSSFVASALFRDRLFPMLKRHEWKAAPQ